MTPEEQIISILKENDINHSKLIKASVAHDYDIFDKINLEKANITLFLQNVIMYSGDDELKRTLKFLEDNFECNINWDDVIATALDVGGKKAILTIHHAWNQDYIDNEERGDYFNILLRSIFKMEE